MVGIRERMGVAVMGILATLFVLSGCDAGFGRSGNADLSSLTVTGASITPSFSADELNYSATVSQATTQVTINAEVADSKSSLRIAGVSVDSGVDIVVSLVEGENDINVRVTAENELSRTYHVVITRSDTSSDDADLAALDVVYTPTSEDFLSTDLEYDYSVPYWVNSTWVVAERSNEQALLALNGSNITNGEATASLSLSVGDNDVDVEVTAGDLETIQTYEMDITRDELTDLDTADYVKATNFGNSDFFGTAVAVDQTTLMVGAPREDETEIDSGAVYVFNLSGNIWSQSAVLKADDVSGAAVVSGARLGSSLALDDDWLAVGAPGDGFVAESVFLYQDSGSVWGGSVRLSASDASVGDGFGSVLALEGEWLAVGAPSRSAGAGAVYLFQYDSDDEEWSQFTTLTVAGAAGFGTSVALNPLSSVPELVVGAPDTESGEGRVYVYRYDTDATTDQWGTPVTLTASDAGASDSFGAAVDALRDRIAIGAPQAGYIGAADGGAAYVFVRDDTDEDTWTEQDILNATQANNMNFGDTVALSADMLAVGAPLEDSDTDGVFAVSALSGEDENTSAADAGAVFVFSTDGTTWTDEAYVKASNSGTGDVFGSSLAFFGGHLVAGARNEDGSVGAVNSTPNDDGTGVGAVYIFD